ncbi:MAG TPA: hypothetical protein VN643_11045 [Pyrinomonadaceae bacterium]|nr:hypothetical protein [Pyrinomonadaceae bacterium]
MVASERDIARDEQSRRNIVIVVALVAAVAIAGLFYLLMRAGKNSGGGPVRLAGSIQPGSPDWEKYSKLIALDEPEADEANRALGDIVMTLRTTVRNFTGRTITGLEIRAMVIDHQGNPVRERYVVFVPAKELELAPNKTLPVSVVLDGMTETTDRANIRMLVSGFKLK